jgi:glycosyltransferase involved in cell wall biosynthesis
MKLLITLDFPPERGGIQSHLRGIVSHTFTKDDAVYVGSSQIPKAQAALQTRDFPCRVTYLSTALSRLNKKWSLVPLLVSLLALRRRQGVSLTVECGNVYAGLVPWVASVVMPLHYCVYAHGTELLGLRKATPAAFLLRSVFKRARRIIANSLYAASLVRELCPSGRVDVVSPRIDYQPYTAALSSNVRGNAVAVSILCVGRLVRHKGHEVLLDAVSRLPRDTKWGLVVAGQGPLLDELSKQCRNLGISGLVRFKTGLSDEELEKEYRDASVFVLPTVPAYGGTEGFGIVLLEAMAHRIPIIASNTGGIAEVLDNGSCGVLVAPGDPAHLSDAIRRVAGDGALRDRLASAALERLLKRYVWQ